VELEELDSFFEVAKSQNWVSPANILNVQQEYSKLKDVFKNACAAPPRRNEKTDIELREKLQQESTQEFQQEFQHEPRIEIAEFAIPERQTKILEILKEKGKAQVWEIKQIFPQVTKRTLRRDFDNLLKQGKIERIGERNATSYRLIG